MGPPDRAPSLLLVEDDRELGPLVDRVLTGEGYEVTLVADGQQALHRALTGAYDVLVVDRGLPDVEGLDLIGRLRGRGVVTPVLVLSARGSTQDRVDGLDAGAEDYLAKPFEVPELLARLRALLRRHHDTSTTLRVPGGTLSPENRLVELSDGRSVPLSEREAALLQALARRPGQVFRRQDLLARVFEEAESDSAVDTYVHYLRRKLGRDVIRTVHGFGYRLGKLE